MQALYHPSQLKGAVSRAKRQRDVLQVSTGFTDQQKADLTAIYDAFITKGNEIIEQHK